MKTFSVILFIAFAITSKAFAGDCKECPDYQWYLNRTIFENIQSNFARNTPQDGFCSENKQKFIFYGPDYGYTENRCVCVTTPPSKYKKCNPQIPKCPMIPATTATETAYQFSLRVGVELADAPSDGCCPPNSVTWISQPFYTGRVIIQLTINISFNYLHKIHRRF